MKLGPYRTPEDMEEKEDDLSKWKESTNIGTCPVCYTKHETGREIVVCHAGKNRTVLLCGDCRDALLDCSECHFFRRHSTASFCLKHKQKSAAPFYCLDLKQRRVLDFTEVRKRILEED